jgi:hypothetical protein
METGEMSFEAGKYKLWKKGNSALEQGEERR